eukprot:TRINITY_DN38084_c0_g1_i1.p1 TRINITY_DN38084_c0_g1~~TRINITY_DN38084_c0_g1_i1.p1  ORF type:complete len:947 (-),score=193.80 TRINITY_DN38084_c0_g1_i1:215-3055(-)
MAPDPNATKSSMSQTWTSTWGAGTRKPRSPMYAIIDVARFGGALLLSSACEVSEPEEPEEDAGSEDGYSPEKEKDEEEGAEEDKPFGLYNRAVPGGVYRPEALETYRRQCLLGVEIVGGHLEELGVPTKCIEYVDYIADNQPDMPVSQCIRNFLKDLPPTKPDCLIYYIGPSGPKGEWAFDYIDLDDEPQAALLTPKVLEAEEGQPAPGPPGQRFILSDSPYSAEMWGSGAATHMGFAAWSDGGLVGDDHGPPLARWVTGHLPGNPPEGSIAFPLPPDAGMADLPAYKPLFWGPNPLPAERASHLLWEVQAFLGAATRQWKRAESCHEAFARGLVQVIIATLQAHGEWGDEELIVRCLWLLYSVASYSPSDRWLDQFREAFHVVFELFDRRDDVSTELFSVIMDFSAAVYRRCWRCQRACVHASPDAAGPPAGPTQHLARRAVVACLGGTPAGYNQLMFTPDDPFMPVLTPAAAASAARFCCQLFRHEPPNYREEQDREIMLALQQMALRDWENVTKIDPAAFVDLVSEVRRASAEALLMATVHSEEVKRQLLKVLVQMPQFLTIFKDEANPLTISKFLALIRGIAALDRGAAAPDAEEAITKGTLLVCKKRARVMVSVDKLNAIGTIKPGDIVTATGLIVKNSSEMYVVPIQPTGAVAMEALQVRGKDVELLLGDEELPPGTPEAIVHCLCKFAEDAQVQRWGLTALGVMLSNPYQGFKLEDATAQAAAVCVMWALGAEVLGHEGIVEQEALFCAYALMKKGGDAARAKMLSGDGKAAALVAASVSRACKVRDAATGEVLRWGLQVLGLIAANKGGGPQVGPFVNTIVNAMMSPDCSEITTLAGSQTLSIVLATFPPANDNIPMREKRELVKTLQLRARELPQKRRERMEDWWKTLIEALSGLEPEPLDDTPNKEYVPGANSDDEEDNEVFPYDIEQGLKNKKKW